MWNHNVLFCIFKYWNKTCNRNINWTSLFTVSYQQRCFYFGIHFNLYNRRIDSRSHLLLLFISFAFQGYPGGSNPPPGAPYNGSSSPYGSRPSGPYGGAAGPPGGPYGGYGAPSQGGHYGPGAPGGPYGGYRAPAGENELQLKSFFQSDAGIDSTGISGIQ